MRYLLLLTVCLPLAGSAQKPATKNYDVRCSVALFGNGQVITYQEAGVTKSDTLYNADGNHQVTATNVSTTTDYGRLQLPERRH